jgi:IS30 family transposase
MSGITKDAIIKALKPFATWVRNITYDNGREFYRYIDIAKALACDTCFAKPHHSWERGLNENHIGLSRHYKFDFFITQINPTIKVVELQEHDQLFPYKSRNICFASSKIRNWSRFRFFPARLI